jgi:hypothetical protein
MMFCGASTLIVYFSQKKGLKIILSVKLELNMKKSGSMSFFVNEGSIENKENLYTYFI